MDIGLIFTGGEGPEPQYIIQIMEDAYSAGYSAECTAMNCPSAITAPVVVAADSGLLLAESAGVKVDWITGDMDSLGEDAENCLAAYPPEKILRYPSEKDFTDTELAFFLLKENGCSRIWIIGGGGGRLDQLFGIRSLFERDNPPERWLTAADDIRCIGDTPSVPSVLNISYGVPLFPVSVFPLGCGPWKAESSGLKWPLAGLPWTRDFIAISNIAPDGTFTIMAQQGRFLVIMPL